MTTRVRPGSQLTVRTCPWSAWAPAEAAADAPAIRAVGRVSGPGRSRLKAYTTAAVAIAPVFSARALSLMFAMVSHAL